MWPFALIAKEVRVKGSRVLALTPEEITAIKLSLRLLLGAMGTARRVGGSGAVHPGALVTENCMI